MARPLWLFLSEPGLATLLAKELKSKRIIGQKTRVEKLFLRNYDVLVLPDSQVQGSISSSRIALHALRVPVFGRRSITDGQLDRLAAAWRAEKADGVISSVAGNAFERQDLLAWVTRRLTDRGLIVHRGAASHRPVWLIVIDEAYYFGFGHFNYHDVAGHARSERAGSLPPTVAAAMLFAAKLQPREVIWDPVTGAGTILREAREMADEPVLIGTDIDPAAIALAREALKREANVLLHVADARHVDLGRRDLTLVVANLPWGKQFSTDTDNAEFYGAVLRNAMAHAAPTWRACVITSDDEAIGRATAALGLSRDRIASLRVRGTTAKLWLITRSAVRVLGKNATTL